MSGHFYGIGVGPGDPGLLTIKAAEILKKTEVLAVPESKKEKTSIAYSIARPYISKEAEILYLTFPMINDKIRKNRIRVENAELILEHLQKGKTVAFITIGDPLTYSTYIYLLTYLKDCGIPVTTIPGITSFQGIAAGLNLPLAAGEDKVGIFCTFDTALDSNIFFHFDTLIFMKPARYLPTLLAFFRKYRAEYRFYLVSHYGAADEKIIEGWEITDAAAIPYLSTLILRRKKDEN